MENIVVIALIGLLEGLTEFLPISSTGHLIILSSLLDFRGDDEKAFLITIQLAAILAVCWSQRRLITTTVKNFAKERADSLIIKVMVAFIPTALIGLLLHDIVKTYLFSPITVALALVIGGICILVIEQQAREPSTNGCEDITLLQAFQVGIFQALAIFPGVSRSGATILGGLLIGFSRTTAALFSFFLAIPTMFAATVFDLWQHPELLNMNNLPVLALGFTITFVTALLTVNGLIRFVSRHSFKPFGYYRIAFGIIVIVTWSSGLVDWQPI